MSRRAPNLPRSRANDCGFSLVEALVAMAVFAMAGVALASLQSQSLRTLGGAEARALASMVAQNRLVELIAATTAPDLGQSHGDIAFANRAWACDLDVAATSDPRTLRIGVVVREQGKPQVLAQAMAFRPAANGSLR